MVGIIEEQGHYDPTICPLWFYDSTLVEIGCLFRVFLWFYSFDMVSNNVNSTDLGAWYNGDN